MKKFAFLLIFLVMGTAQAAQDCSNIGVSSIVNGLTGTVLVLSSPCDGTDHVCLDNQVDTMPYVQNMYSYLLEHYMNNRALGRMTVDGSHIVQGCGFPLVTEVR